MVPFDRATYDRASIAVHGFFQPTNCPNCRIYVSQSPDIAHETETKHGDRYNRVTKGRQRERIERYDWREELASIGR